MRCAGCQQSATYRLTSHELSDAGCQRGQSASFGGPAGLSDVFGVTSLASSDALRANKTANATAANSTAEAPPLSTAVQPPSRPSPIRLPAGGSAAAAAAAAAVDEADAEAEALRALGTCTLYYGFHISMSSSTQCPVLTSTGILASSQLGPPKGPPRAPFEATMPSRG